MKKLDLEALPIRTGSSYPPPHDAPCRNRNRKRLAAAGGLTAFGVNLLTLPPGAWSSQRHWHTHEDELAFVLEGEVVLITDAGEEILRAGDCATFRAGDADGHHLVNRSGWDAKVLELGNHNPADRCVYPDADMVAEPQDDFFRHADGTPYPKVER